MSRADDTSRRIAAIKESATLLSRQSWSDIDLILRQHDFPTSDSWQGDNQYAYVVDMIQYEPSDKLHLLHQYLIGESGDIPTGAQLLSQGKLKLFMSHLAVHQEFVGYVAGNLGWYGVSSFVAHVSIEPSKEWQDVLEGELQ